MTDREKLIELLDKIQYHGNATETGINRIQNSNIADYLLTNGVIVLPCKVGDTLFGISRGKIISLEVCIVQYTSRGVKILVRDERYFGNGFITLDGDNKIGMEWYHTKAQAENSLKRGDKNEKYR